MEYILVKVSAKQFFSFRHFFTPLVVLKNVPTNYAFHLCGSAGAFEDWQTDEYPLFGQKKEYLCPAAENW
jgi:hypothetical protein